MQSSCNLIKNQNALVSGGKKIRTIYHTTNGEILEQYDEEEINTTEMEELVSKYEDLASTILMKARSDAEKIVLEARQQAVVIEKDAYEKGYEQGSQNGYDDGYKKGYEQAIVDSENKVNTIINRASSILSTASNDYKNYMDSKKFEITELCLEISRIVCNKNFEKEESILRVIEPIIENYKGEKSLIIRCNTEYLQAIKEKAELWKNTYNIKGEIFILEDPLMEMGNAIVETEKGKATVGIDITFEKIEKIVREKMIGGINA